MLQLSLLFAESTLPVGKGIAMILFFGAVGIFSTIATFVPAETLGRLSNVIGTKNPTVARTICVITAIVGLGAVALTIASLTGALS